jgi:hypothetical protein
MSDELTEVVGYWSDIGTAEEPLPHVSWLCPACGHWHDDDIEPNDRPPLNFECSRVRYNQARFLVRWEVKA